MVHPAESGWTSKSFSTNISSHCIYTSAFCERSRFVFFGEDGRPVGLKLTYRVPGQRGSASTIKIEVNGFQLTQAPAQASWQTFEVCVLSDCVTDGLNELVITWPDEGDIRTFCWSVQRTHCWPDACLAFIGYLAKSIPCGLSIHARIRQKSSRRVWSNQRTRRFLRARPPPLLPLNNDPEARDARPPGVAAARAWTS